MGPRTASVAALAALVLSGGCSDGGGATETATTVAGPPLAANQTEVTGVLTSADGAQIAGPVLALPLTMQVARGGGTKARFSGASVGNRAATAVWDGGRPLPLSGQGSLDLRAPADVDVTRAGVTWRLDGSDRALTAGRYRLGATVAVVTTGLGEPRDGVELVVATEATVATSGGVTVTVPPRETSLSGPGSLRLEGELTARTAAGPPQQTARVQFGPGPFEITLRPRPDGRWDVVRALLQGAVTMGT